MSLSETLLTIPPREISGAQTASRYDFQALWGLTLLLQKYPVDIDYSILFEFHDDVVLVNSSSEPTIIKFYQVKTKNSNKWTINALTKREVKTLSDGITKNTLPSIVGKLIHNTQLFKDFVESADFVSNAEFSFGPDVNEFRLAKCIPQEIEKFKEAIKTEFDGTANSQADVLGFIKTDLSLEDTSTHLKGKLHEFVSDHLGSISYNLDALHNTIVDDCRRKSKHSGSYSSISELVKAKGLSKANVDEWLNTIREITESPDWEEVSNELDYSFSQKLKLRAQWSIYRSAVLNAENEAIRKVRRDIRKSLSKHFSEKLSLTEIVEKVYGDVLKLGWKTISPLNPERMKVMIIYEIYANDQA